MSPYGLWIGPGTTVGIAFCARSGKPLVRSSVTAEPCSGLSGKFLSEAQLHYPARCAGGQGGNRSKIGFTYSYRSIKPLPPFTILILVMIFLFLILRKRSRNKNVKIIIYHMSQVIQKKRWGICSHFPWDAVKVSAMIQKGAVQTTCYF